MIYLFRRYCLFACLVVIICLFDRVISCFFFASYFLFVCLVVFNCLLVCLFVYREVQRWSSASRSGGQA